MALRLSSNHDESDRARMLRGVRLTFAGGVLGTALLGVGSLILGFQTQPGTDAIGAVAGMALAALYLFYGVDDH